MGVLQGWHRGERSIQEKLGFAGPMSMAYQWIDGEMDEQHRDFHTTRLPFIPVTTLDNQNRPWTSIFAGTNGTPGFVSSPWWNRLNMDIKVWEGDPFWENHENFNGEKMLVAGIGIEFPTRRRNKFAGHVFEMTQQKKDQFRLKLEVNQAIGNCPKYINVRELDPHPDTHPVVAHKVTNLPEDGRMPEELVEFVRQADTIFIGSYYQARPEDSMRFPSHVGQNQRGGRKGWVRVRNDGRTVVVPDYSGNRLMTSLGNIEATPVAAVTIVNFVTGDILYLTGDARTAVGPEAQSIMPRQRVVTLLEVTGYTFVRDALPVRQRPGTSPVASPYSPPVRLLAEESSGASKYFEEETAVTLARVKLLSKDLATFTWESSKPVSIQPGQTAILDFSDLLGQVRYQHMAPFKPSSVNDDRIRTWTVSSAHLSPEGTRTFDLTMREKEGGAVTGALFTIARKLAELRPELLDDTRDVGLAVKLVGLAGDFTLALPAAPAAPTDPAAPPPMLWLAGGIGVTPFLSMLAAIARAPPGARWDVVLALSTREPGVLLPLLAGALAHHAPRLRLALHVFSSAPVPPFPALAPADELEVSVHAHKGRVDAGFLASLPDLAARKPYMCGPEEFERAMLRVLGERGVKGDVVVRESFEY
ncbi:FAD/NAD(P)-binding domain-containing protein [Phanerochaete sordida]|uniref:FAD/NAD(P)-binding domain-containing protein n=1 Tax=Phanerochaete sordida TaxID=48140 RepID=A0A9P3GAJ7_9APHY|nr:FAD/NAD(P)-binding domain-containing protein [Phanerochaete sordida]